VGARIRATWPGTSASYPHTPRSPREQVVVPSHIRALFFLAHTHTHTRTHARTHARTHDHGGSGEFAGGVGLDVEDDIFSGLGVENGSEVSPPPPPPLLHSLSLSSSSSSTPASCSTRGVAVLLLYDSQSFPPHESCCTTRGIAAVVRCCGLRCVPACSACIQDQEEKHRSAH
jgi:hypothetical protein